MSQQQQIPPFSSNSPPPIDLDFTNDDLDFHEEPPPLDDYPVDVEEDLKEGFDIDLNDSELPELPNDLNEFEQHSSNTTDAEIIPDCFDRPSQETSTLGNETPFQKLVKQDEPTAETTSVTISQSDLNIEKDEFFEFNSGPAIVEPTGGNQQEDFIKSLPVLTKPFNNAPIQESLGQLNNNIDDIEVDKSNSISNSGDDLDQTEERPESKEINSSFELEDLDFIIPVEGAIPLSKAQENHDDFSDFNDFKSAPVTENVECEVQVFEPQIVQPQAVSFEANFASFGESGETSMDDFDDFQDFSSTQEHSYESKLQVREFEAEDDDDFGDFSDFKQTAQIPTNEINQESFFRKDNLVSVLDMMFPKLSTDTETVDFQNNELNQSEIIRNLNNFDTSKALGYQYNSSRSSQTLVKALGIDTRNILHGAQWNSSMPRYAANLSFSPLEPLKPSTSSSTDSPSLPSKSHGITLSSSTEVPVPDVQFDWNGSGLVNPLEDGVQEILQQERGVPTTAIITVPTIFEADQGKLPSSLDQATTQVSEEATPKPEVLDDPTFINSTYQWQQSEVEEETPKPFIVSSSNIRTIKLPETHIFTPVKGISPISQEVVSEDLAVPAAVDGAYIKNKILVKEYHDVEYSLEVPKRQDEETEADDSCEFNDFQSVPAVWSQPSTANEVANPSILQPHKLQECADKIEIKWPEPGNILNTEDYIDLTSIANSFLEGPHVEQILDTEKVNLSISVNFKSKEKYTKPTIGKSPTDDADDDFSDFQTAPLPPQLTMSVVSLQQPMVPYSNNVSFPGKSINGTNSVDDDEISRIEAAFPKCKVATKKPAVVEEPVEEEWNDFVSLPNEPSSIYTSMQNQINSSQSAFTNNTRSTSNNSSDDYWSDFVSVPSKSVGPLSSGRPNFSSWNQPSIAPSLSAFGGYSNDLMLSTGNSKVPTSNNFVNITNNFNYNVAPNHHLRQFSNSYQPQQQQQPPNTAIVRQHEIPNISILPGLSFSIPKIRPSSNATKK